VHREFLNVALKGLNLVRPHERAWPREAIALIDHDETQCLVHVDIDAEFAYVRFCAQLKQGWVGRDLAPRFVYEERVTLTDLEDPTVAGELGRRLRAMDQAWSSRRAVARTAETEASGTTTLFRGGKRLGERWSYFRILAQALDGRRVTPRWVDNEAFKFARWAGAAAGPACSPAAQIAESRAFSGATSAGLIAMAAQQAVIPTNRPHAFADR
jgi:hypothetical protein